MNRYEEKIARMRAGKDTRYDFILADAKDSDMAAGISAMGNRRNPRTGQSLFRTRPQYLSEIQSIIRQDIVDIMLTSVSILEDLLERDAFDGTKVRHDIPSASARKRAVNGPIWRRMLSQQRSITMLRSRSLNASDMNACRMRWKQLRTVRR